MSEVFQLVDPDGAQAFLRSLPEEAQRKGQARFRDGAVESLTVVKPGTRYSATVADAAWKNQVSLYHEDPEGWDAECTCPAEFNCAHVFAAMSALMAEHRMTVVRQLSTGQATGGAGKKTVPAKAEPDKEETLAEQLVRLNGRRLFKDESSFLNRLHQLYLRCCQTRSLTYWDLQQMQLVPTSYSWAPLNIWPSFPRNEHEFWLYVANYIKGEHGEVPDFMAPVTDLSQIAERLARWRRSNEIEKWTNVLAQHQPSRAPTAAQQDIDLRVMIQEDCIQLQWLRPDHAQFETLKQGHLRRLQENYDFGVARLSPEAELIWQLFSNALDYGASLDFDSNNAAAAQAINRLLRAPTLQSRVVTAAGRPLLRETQPLRWNLSPAESDEDDYRLALVQADGSAVPPIWCVLPGNPTLYLTNGILFPGPPTVDILDISKENRIPAPAIERAGGLSFLQALGVELPPRVRERVRTLPYRVTISCSLRPTFPGSDTEECIVAVLADASDGRQQTWDGFNWIQKKTGAKRSKADPFITIYDTAILDETSELLEPLNLKPSRYQHGLSMRLTRKFADTFASWLKTVPAHITVNLEGELASLANGDVAGKVKLEVTEQEIDWFDLQVVLDVADTTLTPAEIKLLLNAKGSYVRLNGKGWRRLQYDLNEEENDRLARLGVSPKELSAEPQRLHALQLADDAAKRFLPTQQVEQIQRRAAEIKARVAPPLPAAITAQLRPYQLEGFHFLAYLAANRFGGILADDMGLGKTLQTLAWLTWLREQHAQSNGEAPNGAFPAPTPPSLVVCPKSVMDNWHAEAARFAPGLRVKSWPAAEVGQLREQLDCADIHVINYNQLRLLGESLSGVHWLALVLDEGQYIKNPSSQTAQVARGLKASSRLVLSGTPIENRLMDLWSLMAFTMPGILGSRAQFARLYDAKGDPLARKRLAARVRPFLLRRTKTQVAKDLPDRIEEDLFCEIEGEQQTLYRAELKAAQQLLLRIKTQKELAHQQFHFLTSLLRLRQICCHPRLIQPDSKASSAKCESLLEQLEPLMEEGQKVLVFSQFVQMLDLLRPSLEERNWPVFYLAGQTENRGELVQRFQAQQGAAIFLISLKAGGFGLNLTAASYVVLFDPWWNPAVESQAIDRTHRIGQANKVIAYRLLIKNSIEEKIRELQKQKRALVEDVLGEEKFAQSLTLEDLQYLLADPK